MGRSHTRARNGVLTSSSLFGLDSIRWIGRRVDAYDPLLFVVVLAVTVPPMLLLRGPWAAIWGSSLAMILNGAIIIGAYLALLRARTRFARSDNPGTTRRHIAWVVYATARYAPQRRRPEAVAVSRSSASIGASRAQQGNRDPRDAGGRRAPRRRSRHLG